MPYTNIHNVQAHIGQLQNQANISQQNLILGNSVSAGTYVYAAQLQAQSSAPTILQQLLGNLWQAEEESKRVKHDGFLSRITEALRIKHLDRRTEVQEKILNKWGGYYCEYEAAIAQQNMLIQAQYNATQGQLWNTISAASATPGQILGGYPPTPAAPTHPNYSGTVHYRLMRGMEQTPGEDIHQYDDDASNMTDYRLYKQEVPLTWVISFSLSNGHDPEMAIRILEHHGYVLLSGDEDD